MSESPPDPRREVALFRFKVIAGLLHLKAGSPEAGEALRANAELTYQIPGSRRTRVAAGTMRGWIEAYREGGFDALHPKPRSDRGRNRRIPPELAELLVEIKQRSPHLSGRAVRRKALESDQMPVGTAVALSSVYRLLHGAGLMDRPETKPPPRTAAASASLPRLRCGSRTSCTARRSAATAQTGAGARNPICWRSLMTRPGWCPTPPSPFPRASPTSCPCSSRPC